MNGKWSIVRNSSVLVSTLIIGASMLVATFAAAQAIEATTATGDKVLLHPNGRWEYVDAQKAAAAREVASHYPENQGCPPGTQGGLFGIGRCVKPGDKDWNRGTLNPAKR